MSVDPQPPRGPSSDLLTLGTGNAGRVRRAAFARLRSGTAVMDDRIAADTGLPSSDVRRALAELAATGSVNLDARMRVVAVGGLSVVPAAHELSMDGCTFWTWCAFDAVGIPAALGLDAVARTRCGDCRAQIEVSLTRGLPPSDSAVVGWLPGRPCTNVQSDFCPDANLFCSQAHLNAWLTVASSPPGEARTLQELADLGTRVWAEMRAVRRQP